MSLSNRYAHRTRDSWCFLDGFDRGETVRLVIGSGCVVQFERRTEQCGGTWSPCSLSMCHGALGRILVTGASTSAASRSVVCWGFLGSSLERRESTWWPVQAIGCLRHSHLSQWWHWWGTARVPRSSTNPEPTLKSHLKPATLTF